MQVPLKEVRTGKVKHGYPVINEKTHAVYFIYGEKDNLLYIGKSCKGRLSTRLRSHEKTNHHFMREVSHIKVMLFDNDCICSLCEIYYIATRRPTFNKDVSKDLPPLSLFNFKEEMYKTYSRGEIEDIRDCKNHIFPVKGRLEAYKKTFIGQQFGFLIVKDVYQQDGYYKAKSVCSCGQESVNTLCGLRQGNVKTCGVQRCVILHSSPYAEEYKKLETNYKISIPDLKLWHKKYNNILRSAKNRIGIDLKISFEDYIRDIKTKGIKLKDISNKRGYWKFCYNKEQYIFNK